MTPDDLARVAAAAVGEKNWDMLVAHIVARGVDGYRAGLRAKAEALTTASGWESSAWVLRADVLALIDGSSQ